VGIEISATHHRAASAGVVTGVATLLHGGRTTASYEVVLRDEQGRRLCTSRLTCLITDRLPGASGPGASPPGAGPPRAGTRSDRTHHR